MADQDNVGWSHEIPSHTVDVTYKGVVNILEAIRNVLSMDSIKFFQPVSATMFGNAKAPQNEHTPFDPKTPYAIAKTAAYHTCQYYRERYDMFICTGIMYNHDSPRRSEDYLVNTICRQAIRVQQGNQENISLGNLDLLVDIGHAKEYMQAAFDMMQLDKPDNYVIGTRVGISISTLAIYALMYVGCSTKLVSVNPEYSTGRQPRLISNTLHAKQAFGFDATLRGESLIGNILEEMSR
jgi:GDPmannose 4,6-dehydratase